MIKSLLEHYKLPTPEKWRHIGNALLAACLAALPFVGADHPLLRIVTGGLIIGKFITELATK
jgi:hypothetical protein